MASIGEMKFIEGIDRKVRKTISKHKLFGSNGKIAVAASGGKDSTVCLHILKKLGYDVEAVIIDVGIGDYTDKNLENLKKICKSIDVKLNEVHLMDVYGKNLHDIKSSSDSAGLKYSYCMLCGTLKKYMLNKFAKDNNFDYVATGHNLDDEAEAFMMNLFRSDYFHAEKQGPKSRDIESGAFVQRVKPLFFVTNKETRKYCELMGFLINFEPCPCSSDAHRRKFRNVLNGLEEENPQIKSCIIRFLEKMKDNAKERNYGPPNACELCSEPCSGKICKRCEIMKHI
jgi:uncharacterized protein (TIGR00269 family)